MSNELVAENRSSGIPATGLSRTAVLNRLRLLTEADAVVSVGATRSPKRRW